VLLRARNRSAPDEEERTCYGRNFPQVLHGQHALQENCHKSELRHATQCRDQERIMHAVLRDNRVEYCEGRANVGMWPAKGYWGRDSRWRGVCYTAIIEPRAATYELQRSLHAWNS
jgi:hypothetical protein